VKLEEVMSTKTWTSFFLLPLSLHNNSFVVLKSASFDRCRVSFVQKSRRRRKNKNEDENLTHKQIDAILNFSTSCVVFFFSSYTKLIKHASL
jgi:hypothetical protein